MKRLWKLPNIAVIGLLFVLLCGFALAGGKLLFQEELGNVKINYTANEEVTLDSGLLEKMRHSLSEVKAKLNKGETAVLYFAELGANRYAFQSVSNPEVVNDLDSWSRTVSHQNPTEHIPESLPGSFKFAQGMESPAYGAFIDSAAFKLLDDMKVESKQTGKDVVWRKTAVKSKPVFNFYTSLYRNAEQQTIYYTLQIPNEKVRMEGITSPTSVYEDLNIHGHPAHYTLDNQSLYGASKIAQYILWMEEKGDQTLIYQVGTDSPTVTKQQLIQAAQSL
ncbi:hypothetical protein EJP77_14415 [Paenibacillus zeisoli]|uniref:DUF4367 domain-containing protein n=1 Tax=Paenibacillus zeisoli TaxID=2496267 RepID=A0A3S1DVV0_9BACL|nr:hypothetical protein [Paenibacillus zeisoli]RUT29568.1 hypothetical protein EJP77_14415 [Paenibacillus zeisoli]